MSDILWQPQPGGQEAAIDCPVFEVLLVGNRGGGKLQPLDSKVLTRKGWKRMGDLKVGQRVMTPKGVLVPITHVFEHKDRDIYRLTFSDGATCLAGDEHLWKYRMVGQVRKAHDTNWHVNDTMAMKAALDKGHAVLIPTVDPLPLVHPPRLKKLRADPYLLGLWLGDGYHRWSNRVLSVGITTADDETVDYIKQFGFKRHKDSIQYVLNKGDDHTSFYRAISKLGLGGTKAPTKFVPHQYKQAPIHVRTAILQGLMDSDGYVDADGRTSFTSISLQLAKDVQDLARSLGANATLSGPHPSYCNGERKRDHYDVYIQAADKFSCFRLTRKKERERPYMHDELCRRLRSVEYVGKMDARCIRLDDVDHLYITDDYIVTHNSDVLLFSYFRYVGCGFGEAWRGVIFRRTYQDLKNLFKAATKWVRKVWPEAKIVQSAPPRIVWPTGEELLFTYAADIDDYQKHHGWEMPFVGWDELTQWPDLKLYLKMMSICRTDHPEVPLMYRSTTNPYGPLHNVVKKRFGLPILDQKDGNRIGPTIVEYDDEGYALPARVAIEVPREDNVLVYGGVRNAEYVQKLRADSSNPSQIAAWVHGSWDIVAGGIIDDVWDRDVHIVPTPPPSMFREHGWTIRRALDWGESAPFCVQWWADFTEHARAFNFQGHTFGQVRRDRYLIHEWYGSTGIPNEGIRMMAQDVARGIKDFEQTSGLAAYVRKGPADTDIFTERGGGESLAKDMAREGIHWDKARKGPNSRIQGAHQVRKFLKGALPPRAQDPGAFICDQAQDWLRTVPVLPRNEKNLDDADTTAEDHCFAPGTLIQTNIGLEPIENPKGRFIVGPDGTYHPFVRPRKTQSSAETVLLTFSDGSQVQCTPNHLFLEANGSWTQARHLSGKSVILSRNSTGNATTSAGTTSRKKEDGCTERCGNTTADRFRPDTMSTTSMTTSPITSRGTLSASQEASTYPTTPQSALSVRKPEQQCWHTSPNNGTAPPNGIAAQRGVSGIESTQRSVRENGGKRSTTKHATSAVRPIAHPWHPETKIGFVDRHAETATIVSVEKAYETDVYCITVPSIGCFSLANGAVVSNCFDTCKFYLRHKPAELLVKKINGR